MAQYNYIDNMVSDIETVVDGYNFDFEDPDIRDTMYDTLWDDSLVTHNTEYVTVNDNEVKEAVDTNMELLYDAVLEFNIEPSHLGKHFIESDWVYFDSIIRCYLLDKAIDKYLELYHPESI